MNLSSSCASVRPAIEPPSKSDSICLTIDPAAACAMPVDSVPAILVLAHPVPGIVPRRRPFYPRCRLKNVQRHEDAAMDFGGQITDGKSSAQLS